MPLYFPTQFLFFSIFMYFLSTWINNEFDNHCLQDGWLRVYLLKSVWLNSIAEENAFPTPKNNWHLIVPKKLSLFVGWWDIFQSYVFWIFEAGLKEGLLFPRTILNRLIQSKNQSLNNFLKYKVSVAHSPTDIIGVILNCHNVHGKQFGSTVMCFIILFWYA